MKNDHTSTSKTSFHNIKIAFYINVKSEWETDSPACEKHYLYIYSCMIDKPHFCVTVGLHLAMDRHQKKFAIVTGVHSFIIDHFEILKVVMARWSSSF